MSDQHRSDETSAGGHAEDTGEQHRSDEERGGSHRAGGRGGRMGDGIRQGIGVLSAFKEALEETIQEARDRGDLSTDRAKEVMREALDRAQSAAEDAREKLDFAPQGDVDRALGEIDTLKAGLEALQQRVSALEDRLHGSHPSDGTQE